MDGGRRPRTQICEAVPLGTGGAGGRIAKAAPPGGPTHACAAGAGGRGLRRWIGKAPPGGPGTRGRSQRTRARVAQAGPGCAGRRGLRRRIGKAGPARADRRGGSVQRVAVTDPVDIRLLAALADLGKTAVHELAAKVGMDPREVAYRLVALSGSGLPLLVGVESDPQRVAGGDFGCTAVLGEPAAAAAVRAAVAPGAPAARAADAARPGAAGRAFGAVQRARRAFGSVRRPRRSFGSVQRPGHAVWAPPGPAAAPAVQPAAGTGRSRGEHVGPAADGVVGTR